MTRAYPETYLNDAMNNLGDMFDYAINDCGCDAEEFFSQFIISGVAEAFEKGNPKYIAGLSGSELASEVMLRTQGARPDKPVSVNIDKSEEYWAGWSLAYYQWFTGERFAAMQRGGLTLLRVISMYHPLHEADVSKFVSEANGILRQNAKNGLSNLKRIRKASGMTQKELAETTGVSLRAIQQYEQRNKDINRAQALGLIKLARALGCEAEDLLESGAAAD